MATDWKTIERRALRFVEENAGAAWPTLQWEIARSCGCSLYHAHVALSSLRHRGKITVVVTSEGRKVAHPTQLSLDL